MHPTDEHLARKAQKGDKKAVEILYERYVRAIHRFCWYQLHDTYVAQDLTQDIFVEMVHSLPSFEGKGSFKNWIYAIAKHLVLAHLRKKYNLPQTQLTDWIPDPNNSSWIDPDEKKQKQHKQRVLQVLLSNLSKNERQLLTLSYVQNYTSKEVARVTGRTPESVRVAIHRALKKLRRLVESYEQF